MEMKDLSFDQLRAERPDLVEAIQKEASANGATAERERLSALDELKGSDVADKIVEQAKADGRSASEIGVEIAKAMLAERKEAGAKALAAIEEDSKELEGKNVVSVEASETSEEDEIAARVLAAVGGKE